MKKGILSIAIILVFSSFLLMPVYQRQTDIYQGFNFRTDKQSPIGYITSLQIGGTIFKADIIVKDPLNPAVSLPGVAGVMSNINWGTGLKDAIYVSVQVSTQNKMQAAMLALQNGALSGQVKFGLVLYEYDPIARKYFKSLSHVSANLLGSLEKSGQDYNMSVADDASNEVQSPKNFTLQLGILPQSGISQSVTLATSSKATIAKNWGQ